MVQLGCRATAASLKRLATNAASFLCLPAKHRFTAGLPLAATPQAKTAAGRAAVAGSPVTPQSAPRTAFKARTNVSMSGGPQQQPCRAHALPWGLTLQGCSHAATSCHLASSAETSVADKPSWSVGAGHGVSPQTPTPLLCPLLCCLSAEGPSGGNPQPQHTLSSRPRGVCAQPGLPHCGNACSPTHSAVKSNQLHSSLAPPVPNFLTQHVPSTQQHTWTVPIMHCPTLHHPPTLASVFDTLCHTGLPNLANSPAHAPEA